jgi:type IV pilus assembly protein PilA
LSRSTYNHIVILFITYSTPMTKNTKAFTLIELLIVIVIIGILAVALIPRLTGAQASARDTARRSSLQQASTIVSSALGQDSIGASALLATFLGTDTTPQPLNDADWAALVNALSGYGNIPTVDSQNKPFYIASGTNGAYIFSTTLEKGNGNVTGWALGATAANGISPSSVSSLTGYAIKISF